VPRTSHQLVAHPISIVTWSAGQVGACDSAEADGRSLVRTAVADCIDSAPSPDHAYGTTVEVQDLETVEWKLSSLGDPMALDPRCHTSRQVTAAARGRMRSPNVSRAFSD
jgi:hypothetical protein